MAQCPTCGSSISENSDFCPDCGTDLKAGGAQSAPAPSAAPAAPAAGPDASAAPAAPATADSLEVGAAAAPPVADAAASAPSQPEAIPAAPAAPSAPPADGGAATGARLILKRSGAPTSEVFPIGGRVVIGRFDAETGPVDVDMGNLPEATYVSRQHAEMWPSESGGWTIKDLGSRNGVFIRSQGQGQFRRIAGEEPVTSGDEIALGNARFELRVG